jgi:3-hydroxyacyl-CoA dehydrogenase
MDICRAAVIGAGTMGGGIGYVISAAGIEVLLKDVDQGQLDLARSHIAGIYRRSVERGRLTADEAQAKEALVRYSLDYDDLGEPDLVIEAVPERLEVKRSVLDELNRRCPPHTILASNTSALSITELGEASGRPDRLVGLHFFNPAHVMRLVEVIPGQETDPAVTQAMLDFARGLGKTPVAVRECPGFLVNRLLMPYLNEAVICLQEGAGADALATGQAIDAALGRDGFGWPMGPLALMDMLGLDVCHHIIAYLDAEWGERFSEAPLLRALYEAGHLGQKTGQGFYAHDGSETGVVGALIEQLRAKGQVSQRPTSGIVERTMALLINEAFLCLEGEIASAEDLDLACKIGLGMQVRWEGERAPMGPLEYADRVGPDVLLARFRTFEAELGRRFRPASVLRKKAQSGEQFTG